MSTNIESYLMPSFSDEEMDLLLDNVRPVEQTSAANDPVSKGSSQSRKSMSNHNSQPWPTISRKLPLSQLASSEATNETLSQNDVFEILLDTATRSGYFEGDSLPDTAPAQVMTLTQTKAVVKAPEVKTVPAISTTKLTALPNTTRVELPAAWTQELRALSSTILLAAKNQKQRSFLICDVTAGAGAEAIARGLSQVLASTWNSTILYCALAGQPEEMESPGSTALARQEPLYLRVTAHANLHEMTTSRGEVAIADLLLRYDLQLLLGQLKQEFDLMIFDAPSLTTHTEVDLLAAQVDGVILVVRPGVTSKAEVQKVKARLQKANANLLGVVLHQGNKRRARLA